MASSDPRAKRRRRNHDTVEMPESRELAGKTVEQSVSESRELAGKTVEQSVSAWLGERPAEESVAGRNARLEQAGSEGPTLAEAPRTFVDPTAARLERDPGFAQRYVPGKVLGQGGMGRVELHRDRQIGRHVALKKIRADIPAYAQDRVRFIREARIQGQLEHPSVVPVYDLALDVDGNVFFTMRRVNGLTLEEVIERLQMGAPRRFREEHSRRRLVAAFSRLCLAVHYAHEHGVLHRDLKPGNFILGEFGEAYLLDWGLAGLANPEAADRVRPLNNMSLTRQTLPGAVIGTAGYMSPEQAKGMVDELTPSSDVYSLGAVLFELLTLTPLHCGQTRVERIENTLRAKERHRRPSHRAPEQEVDAELEAIVLKATEPRPENRYPSARALHDDLEAYLDGRRSADVRHEESSRHAEVALEAAAKRTDLRPAEQREAVSAAIAALALEPENSGLQRAFFHLLTHVPREAPAVVEERLVALEWSRARWLGGAASLSYAAMFVYLPLIASAGVTDWVPLVAAFACLLAAAVLGLAVARRTKPTPALLAAALSFSTLGLTATAPFLGPLLFTPALIALNCGMYGSYGDRALRRGSFVLGSLGIGASVGAGLLGLLPSEYAFEGGALLIRSGAFQLAPLATYVLLGSLAVAQLLIGVFGVVRIRSDLRRVEQRAVMTAWLLRGLLKAEDGEG